MADSHLVHVRDKKGFLLHLMTLFTGGRLTLEGDLSRCVFPVKAIHSKEETALLRRATIEPRQDFIVLKLDEETDAEVMKQIMVAGLSHAIIHVQIELDGTRQLGAYDNFHRDCVVTGTGVSETLLRELKAMRIIRGFTVVVETP